MNEIYIVAVGAQPLIWAVQCDICDDLITDGMRYGYEIVMLEKNHIAFHQVDNK